MFRTEDPIFLLPEAESQRDQLVYSYREAGMVPPKEPAAARQGKPIAARIGDTSIRFGRLRELSVCVRTPGIAAAGSTVMLYGEDHGELCMQPCRVRRTKSAGDSEQLVLRVLGDPVPVERRASDHVDVSGHGVTATVDNGPVSLVLNVGALDLAIVSTKSLDIGQRVEIRLKWGDEEWAGAAIARHARLADARSTIYGFECLEGEAGTLGQGLEVISTTLRLGQAVGDPC